MHSISTQNLAMLPTVDRLKRLLQSLATLDAIITLDDGGYYDFRSRWARNQQIGIMDDGSGDTFFAYFNTHGCFLKGFAHESIMSPYQHDPPKLWPGLLDDVPAVFDSALNEPAFMMSDTTFAIWRLNGDSEWQTGRVDRPANKYGDGSEEMLSILDADPTSYIEWAAEYYEMEIDPEPVHHIYEQLPLSSHVVSTLNPGATIGNLQNALVRIGYPGISPG